MKDLIDTQLLSMFESCPWLYKHVVLSTCITNTTELHKRL